MHYLLHYDCSSFRPANRPPLCMDAMVHQKMLNLPPAASFVHQFLANHKEATFPTTVQAHVFYEEYQRFGLGAGVPKNESGSRRFFFQQLGVWIGFGARLDIQSGKGSGLLRQWH